MSELSTFRCVYSGHGHVIPEGTVVVAAPVENEAGDYWEVQAVLYIDLAADYGYVGGVGQRGWRFPLDGNVWKWERVDG